VKHARLLDAEVGTRQIKVDIGSVADRRYVARPVPGRSHGKELAHRRDFPGYRQAADLRQMNTNEVDQPTAHQRQPFVRVVEQLSHGDGRAGLRSHVSEIANVLRAERILQEEKAKGLQVLGQPDGHDRRHAFVHVVE
jgi:hypothetical protein